MVSTLKWRRKSLRWVCFFDFILNSIEFQSRSIFCSGAENSKETSTLKISFTHCIHSTTNYQLRNKWQKSSPKINVLNAEKVWMANQSESSILTLRFIFYTLIQERSLTFKVDYSLDNLPVIDTQILTFNWKIFCLQ